MDTNILACRCGGGSPRKRLTDYLPPKQAARAASNVVTVAPAGPPKFCNKCGWVVKTVKFVDRQSNAIVEKTTCTNKQCIDYV